MLWCYRRSESEHQVRNVNNKIKHIINSREGGDEMTAGIRWQEPVSMLTSYFHSGRGSPCAASPFSRQELCLCREQHRAARISHPLLCRVACLQHMAPKQSSLSSEPFGNSQDSKTSVYIERSKHTQTLRCIRCFIYNSRFCTGTGQSKTSWNMFQQRTVGLAW